MLLGRMGKMPMPRKQGYQVNSSADKLRIDLLITNASEVLTCAESAEDLVGRIPGGAVAVAGERIVAVGPADEVARHVDASSARVIDAAGGVVAPGFVDCHTHVVFGGSRAAEYAARLTMSPEQVAALGIPTGILATVEMTRAASVESLVASASARLDGMLRAGTTTVESKTGYGLTLADELKMLHVNARLADAHAVDIVSTFLGAHAVPPEMSPEQYVDLVVNEMIPQVAGAGLAEYCDVFCEAGYFSADQSRRILQAGQSAGLAAKIHVDEYADIGGGAMAAELGAASADHLNCTPRDTLRALAQRSVVGVVMPALDFAVNHPHPFDARAMLAEGISLALATDICPGCWCESMQVVMQLACRRHGMRPGEALRSATLHAARAVGRDDDRGSLEAGKLADIQIWNVPSLDDVISRIGNNAVAAVIRRGRVHEFGDAPG